MMCGQGWRSMTLSCNLHWLKQVGWQGHESREPPMISYPQQITSQRNDDAWKVTRSTCRHAYATINYVISLQ
jgi:hypothetical protein